MKHLYTWGAILVIVVASVIGDIKATRISIEDGAYCKGRIEIDRGRSSGASPAAAEPEPQTVNALVPVGAN